MNPSLDSARQLIQTMGYSGSLFIESFRLNGDTLLPVDGKEVWEEDSTVYQRKFIYLPDGQEADVALGSMVNGEDYLFSGW